MDLVAARNKFKSTEKCFRPNILKSLQVYDFPITCMKNVMLYVMLACDVAWSKYREDILFCHKLVMKILDLPHFLTIYNVQKLGFKIMLYYTCSLQ